MTLFTQGTYVGSSNAASMSSHIQASAKKNDLSNVSNDRGSFEQYLLNALNSVNDNQVTADTMAEKLITDPESIDVHDVTIAMAKAGLSLSIAQTVIDRVVKGWNEITTTR